MFKNLRKKKKGFTLIELIIVIAIIAILAAVAIPKFGSVRRSAEDKAMLANAKTIANAAAVLVEEGKLKTTTKAEKVDEDSEVGKYLQSIPKISGDENFYITVDSNGTVAVFTDKEGKEQIYPEKKTIQ